MMYAKIVFCTCATETWGGDTSFINKKIDYIFEIYNGIPLIALPYFSLKLSPEGAQNNQ